MPLHHISKHDLLLVNYCATTAKKDQKKKLHNAVYGNLKLMRKALTDKQYAEYARVLNVTLQNKGIEMK